MPLSCFVVRPFNVRKYRNKAGEAKEVDFNRVHAELIAPAIQRAGLEGNTTEDIAQAGNIREDMFALLAHADVVIADVSLHNANVFYELGARHALRPRRTFLIRFDADEVPFDLKTDRYLSYDADQPGASVARLAEGLKATIDNEGGVDSPIFKLLPALKAPEVAELVPVPQGFREEVQAAAARGGLGHLLLLSEEADQLPWGAEGIRLVGRALFKLKAWPAARSAWERVRSRGDGDLEADLKLATIHQRLDDLASSDLAVQRALARSGLTPRERAEAHSLAGSNAKQRWTNAWARLPPEQAAQVAAQSLHSPVLEEARAAYAAGFAADLNHFYSGINAFSLARIRLEIADAQPELWQSGFDDDQAAANALALLKTELADLAGAVQWSVRREVDAKPPGSDDARWAQLTAADLSLLRKALPKRVVVAFQRALEGAAPMFFDVARRQLALYRRLGLFAEQLAALDQALPGLEEASAQAEAAGAPPLRVLVFSGHRIDAPGRKTPRFPAEGEARAAQAIDAQIDALCAGVEPARVRGIAGGASGGDLLFHEVCAKRGIPTALKLAMPEADYIVASVAVEGRPGWIERFQAVRQRCTAAGRVAQLCSSAELPRWLARVKGYDLWERNNRWTLLSALAFGADKVRLIVLWDGQAGDGPGGTQHMVQTANAAGAEVYHLDTRQLFGAGGG